MNATYVSTNFRFSQIAEVWLHDGCEARQIQQTIKHPIIRSPFPSLRRIDINCTSVTAVRTMTEAPQQAENLADFCNFVCSTLSSGKIRVTDSFSASGQNRSHEHTYNQTVCAFRVGQHEREALRICRAAHDSYATGIERSVFGEHRPPPLMTRLLRQGLQFIEGTGPTHSHAAALLDELGDGGC